MRAMAGQTAGPIETKLGMGTHVSTAGGGVLTASVKIIQTRSTDNNVSESQIIKISRTPLYINHYKCESASDISVLKFISVSVSISFSANHFYFYIISVLI